MNDWQTAIVALPAKPSRRGFLGRIPSEYTRARQLLGLHIGDIASVYGRPSWWRGEPATGGLIAGWSRRPYWAVRFSPAGNCTDVYERGERELDLSWRVRALGEVRGRSIAQVTEWLGPPNARSTGHNHVLLQWQRVGYHVVLKFGTDGECLGVVHQWMRNPS